MKQDNIGLRGIGTALPERFVPLAKLKIDSPAENLAAFGFEGAFIADDLSQLARQAADRALANAGVNATQIDTVLWVSALASGHRRASAKPSGNILDDFCYAGSWLQEEMGLCTANVMGIAQQGCAGMFSALRSARALLCAEPAVQNVLCVGADALPVDSTREILYNVISDAACAVVVSRGGERLRWRGFHQLSKGYYWDVPAMQSEIIAAYFPSARAAILGGLLAAGLTTEDIDLVIPTGVNASSWPIVLRLCGIPEDRLYEPKRRFGHTIAADSFLMLEEARAEGQLKPGMRVLLFTYGFGSSWCTLILEVTEEAAS